MGVENLRFLFYNKNAPAGGGHLPFFGKCPCWGLIFGQCPRRGVAPSSILQVIFLLFPPITSFFLKQKIK